MDYKKSAFILEQEKQAIARASVVDNAHRISKLYRELPASRLPPEWMMNVIGSHDATHFRNTALWSLPMMVRRGQITPESHVVDIGSGCGRFALPFSLLIKEGRYYGVDVFRDGVNWCNEHISSQNPAFSFHVQDVESNYYDAGKVTTRNRQSLDFIPDGTIDFAFAVSVFTHLVQSDAEQYFQELRRVLKPTGVAYITTFIIDRYFRTFVERTGRHASVKEVSPGHYQAYKGQDFFSGYTMERWRDCIEREGLEIHGFDPGAWCAKPGAYNQQDTFLLVRA